MCQKCGGDCGLWVLHEIIKKEYPENLKKIMGAILELLLTEEILSITAGSDRGSYAKPRYASVILSLAGVVGESLSFSTLQKMQRWLRPDSNARLEATYRHSLIRRRARNDHGHHGRLVEMIICELFRNLIFLYLLDYEVRSFTSIVFQSEIYSVGIHLLSI